MEPTTQKSQPSALVISTESQGAKVGGRPHHCGTEPYIPPGLRTYFLEQSAINTGPKNHVNTRISHTLVSGIPLILGLRTRTLDPHAHVVSWDPNQTTHSQYGLRVQAIQLVIDTSSCCSGGWVQGEGTGEPYGALGRTGED